MKKTPSPEQQRQRAERKARFALLINRVAKMSDEEKAEQLAGCQIVNCDGRALSPRNQMFIMWQLGRNVSIVGGFRQWLKQSRCVRKGEHGATILFPRTYGKASVESGESQAGTDANGNARMLFLAGTVFDISQTDEISDETTQTQNEAIVEHCGNLVPA